MTGWSDQNEATPREHDQERGRHGTFEPSGHRKFHFVLSGHQEQESDERSEKYRSVHDAGDDRDSSEYKSKRNTNALTDAEVQDRGALSELRRINSVQGMARSSTSVISIPRKVQAFRCFT